MRQDPMGLFIVALVTLILLSTIKMVVLIQIERRLKELNPLVLALTQAVSDNTVAVRNAVAAGIGSSAPGSIVLSAADGQAIADATTQIAANTKSLVNATPTA